MECVIFVWIILLSIQIYRRKIYSNNLKQINIIMVQLIGNRFINVRYPAYCICRCMVCRYIFMWYGFSVLSTLGIDYSEYFLLPFLLVTVQLFPSHCDFETIWQRLLKLAFVSFTKVQYNGFHFTIIIGKLINVYTPIIRLKYPTTEYRINSYYYWMTVYETMNHRSTLFLYFIPFSACGSLHNILNVNVVWIGILPCQTTKRLDWFIFISLPFTEFTSMFAVPLPCLSVSLFLPLFIFFSFHHEPLMI